MPETPKPSVPDRCRLVLIVPDAITAASADIILQALDGGDVASLIIPVGGRDEVSLQKLAEAVVPAAQARGVAVVIESDTRIAGRVGADGVHLEGSPAELREAIDHLGGRLMVGAGGAKTRDDALDLGEMQPDYMFFGRFGFDNKPEAHSRNLKLSQWWSQMIAIPCIVLGGNSLQSIPDAAATGAEFVALSAAIFTGPHTPAQAVAEANSLLDAHAPAFAA